MIYPYEYDKYSSSCEIKFRIGRREFAQKKDALIKEKKAELVKALAKQLLDEKLPEWEIFRDIDSDNYCIRGTIQRSHSKSGFIVEIRRNE